MRRSIRFTALILGLVAGGQVVQALQWPAEESVTVKAIPGVVVAGAMWHRAWMGLDNADGIVGSPDGGLLFAQEQTSTVQKLDRHDRVSTFLSHTDGAGALSVGPQGAIFAVERTCTDPGRHDGPCNEPTKVAMLAPQQKILADDFADGASLGRLNDLVADARGGVYFTVSGAYYVNANGLVSTIASADSIHANGIMLSPDGKTLYVTDRDVVVAFDVQADGAVTNRRNFASLGDDKGADGMAIDGAGRLYVPAAAGIHVFSAKGDALGVIPAPRRPISVAFSGPGKRTLYIAALGAQGPDGKEYSTPPGVRNTAMSIYKISMLAQGFKGRAK